VSPTCHHVGLVFNRRAGFGDIRPDLIPCEIASPRFRWKTRSSWEGVRSGACHSYGWVFERDDLPRSVLNEMYHWSVHKMLRVIESERVD
jgi:hypothetical protein